MNKLENAELCKKCGGICCKNGGCLWFPSDFDKITIDTIDEMLKNQSSSIVGTPQVVFNKNIPKFVGVTLSLRARNINRGPIDLASITTPCASLTKSGCSFDFEHRPSGGKHLIPRPNLECYEDFEISDIEEEWSEYNKILERLVKRYTGLSVIEEYKKEVMEYLYTWATISDEEIPKYRAVELQEVTNMFIELFPEEVQKVSERIRKEKIATLTMTNNRNKRKW